MPDSGAKGPRRDEAGDKPVEGFDDAVASLFDGELLGPAVHFHTLAVVLAGGIAGMGLDGLAEINRLATSMHYRVHVSVLSPEHPDLGEREVVNTVAQGLNPLLALCETLIGEIAEIQEKSQGRTP